MLKKTYDYYTRFGEMVLEKYYKGKIKIPNPIFTNIDGKLPAIVKPLLVVCGPGFKQHSKMAASLMRVGFARGWAEKFGYAKLISVFDVEREIDNYENPAIFLTSYDYAFFNNATLKKLRKCDSFVWINIHPRMLSKYEEITILEKGQKDFDIWRNVYAKILSSEPKFVWNSTCKETFYWYEGWVDDGLKWETIHPAIDLSIYYPQKNISKFGKIKIAYVGGYWADKAQAFDLYFRKIEEDFYPFGYSKWPYKNYGGKLNETEERELYSTCGLVPLVTAPTGWAIGEITERYFKAPACRAFCISDENPAMKEVFSKNEFLVAENASHFHFLVNEYMTDKIDIEMWKEKGYDAVIHNHLYTNRAQQIMNAFKS